MDNVTSAINTITDVMKLNRLKKLIDERIVFLNNQEDERIKREIETREDAIQDRKNDDYNNQQKQEAGQRKRDNKRLKENEDKIKQNIKNTYGTTIVKEHDLIKQGFTKIVPLQCSKCKIFKTLPYDFINKFGKINQDKDVCSMCIDDSSKKVMDYMENRKVMCSCGIKYYFADDEKRKQHISSEIHKRGIRNNKTIQGATYTIPQLRQIIRANLKADGIQYVANYTLQKKDELIDAINKIPNLIIPIFK